MHMDEMKPESSYGESCFFERCSKRYRAAKESHGTEYTTSTQTKELTLRAGNTTGAAKDHVLQQGMKTQ